MELMVQNPLSTRISLFKEFRAPTLQRNNRTMLRTSAILPETAVSVAVAATVVGVAATLLVKRTTDSNKSEIPVRECDDCGGKGEGFVLQKLSQERAERARKASNDAATRFTSGLPRKWSYCTKCSSARSCSVCGGSGKLAL